MLAQCSPSLLSGLVALHALQSPVHTIGLMRRQCAQWLSESFVSWLCHSFLDLRASCWQTDQRSLDCSAMFNSFEVEANDRGLSPSYASRARGVERRRWATCSGSSICT